MSDYLDPNNEELLKDFFSEAQMQVDTLEQNILVLESEGANPDAVDEIFRAAHTLKGGAATVEMMELSHFTHLVEDALDAIRGKQIEVNEDVVDVLLAAIDIIKAMLGKRMDGDVYGDDTSAIEGRLFDLLPDNAPSKKTAKQKTATAAAAASPATAVAAPPSAASTVASVTPAENIEANDIREMLEAAEGATVYRLSVKFDENGLMNTVGGIQVYTAIKSKGTILKTAPDFDALYGDNFFPVVDYYLASDESAEDLRNYVILPDVSLDATVVDIKTLLPSGEAEVPAAAVATPPAPAVQPAAPAEAPPAKAAAAPASPKAGKEGADAKKAGKEAGSILRVDSKRIDDLLNLVSETVITKATFNQISSQFNELATELHSLESRFRERVKNLFDTLPDFLGDMQNGRSIKDIRKSISDEYSDVFSLFDMYEAE
ncbi:MAG: Hpt domain-containing protein, partial [Spirochaetaceae bacterium]|nr:Hpt domain-containing protein [Spirochaetaceae bacterium]